MRQIIKTENTINIKYVYIYEKVYKIMKYEKEYKQTKDKKTFIILVLNRYPNAKLQTVDRRWYTLRKHFSKLNKPRKVIKDSQYLEYSKEELLEPHHLKKMLLVDMLRITPEKVTRKGLTKYGFNPAEINWLIKEGVVKFK